MNTLLDSVIPGIRCQNPVCQAVAPQGNLMTIRKLLYDGYTCSYCGEVYAGALALTGEQIVEGLENMGVAAPTSTQISKMNTEKLLAELDRMELKLEDVPFSGKKVTNGDIRDYILSKR